MRYKLLFVLGCLLYFFAFVALANAQTPPTVIAGQPFTIEFAHDGLYTTAYRVKVDGVNAGADRPTSILVAGVASTSVAGVAAGAHTLVACAVGTSAVCTPALAFTATIPPPSVPTGLRIVLTVAFRPDGTGTISGSVTPTAP